MKKKSRTEVVDFRNNSFKDKIEREQIPQKLVYDKFYVYELILGTRNCLP